MNLYNKIKDRYLPRFLSRSTRLQALYNTLCVDQDRVLELCRDLSPVFIVGANRSGTSIASYTLSQHPQLEGLFNTGISPEYDKSGHSYGFCESLHLWEFLAPKLIKGYEAFWGLPNFLEKTYRNSTYNKAEKVFLAAQVLKYRETENSPLIKDLFNVLRIGLINDVFPNARFLLVSRSLQDFMPRAVDKWKTDGNNTNFRLPFVSFHWHMVNLIARYELEIYAPERHASVLLDEFSKSPEHAQQQFSSAIQKLGFEDYQFDFSNMKPQSLENEIDSSFKVSGFEAIKQNVEAERQLTHTYE